MSPIYVDILRIELREAGPAYPPHVFVTVCSSDGLYERLSVWAQHQDLAGVAKLAEQAMWAWTSTGLVGLQAYLVSRDDVWTQEPNS